MKKKRLTDHLARAGWTKLLRVMKLTAFLVLILVIDVSASLYSQNSKVSVKVVNGTLSEIFNKIEEQSEYRFFYQNEQIRDVERKSIDVSNKNTLELVSDLLGSTDLTYKLVDRNIIIFPSSERNIMENAFQQQKSVSGKVTDSTGASLPGVSVVVKGSTSGTITDASGTFSLANVSSDATLVFSFIGLKTQEIAVGGKTTINVTLEEESIGLDEVVAVGYGIQKKSDITGAISSINVANLAGTPLKSLDQALQGRTAGVLMVQTSGMPGAGSTVRIRGGNSISGGNEPLYVIDGTPIYPGQISSQTNLSPLNGIAVSDIESMEVLKDASSTAIYGARGANGVILITTKRGKAGKTKISFDSYYAIQNISKEIKLLNAPQFEKFANEADVNAGGPPIYDETVTPETTDWQKLVREDNAPIQNYQLSVSGGDEKTQFLTSVNYYKQVGIIKATDMDRFSFRANLDQKISKTLKYGISLSIAQVNSNRAGTSALESMMDAPPNMPVKDANGNYNQFNRLGAVFNNPVAVVNDLLNNNEQFRLLGNAYGEWQIIKGLLFKSTLGEDIIFSDSRSYIPMTLNAGANVKGDASGSSDRTYTWLNENTLNYNTEFGKNKIGLLTGFTQQSSRWETLGAGAQGFVNDFLQANDLGSGTVAKVPSSGVSQWGLMSFLGRANYGFNNKYLITASIRADGSSRFGKNNRWGYFPSTAIAWRVVEEDFIKQLNLFSNFKVRISHGITGNQDGIGTYPSISRLTNVNYLAGNIKYTGYVPSQIANPDLKWETTIQTDAGIDLGFFKGRLNISADAYYKKTSDLLLNVTIPATSGFYTALKNVGSVENKGIEFSVDATPFDREFKWNLNFNIAFNRNKVLSLGKENSIVPAGGDNIAGLNLSRILIVGQPVGIFYGLLGAGTFSTTDQISASAQPNAKAGDIRFKDISGIDGVPDNKINDFDRTIIGSAQPKFYGGLTNTFSFKNVELSVFIVGTYGNNIYNADKARLEDLMGWSNNSASVLNRWTPENQNTLIPRALNSKFTNRSWDYLVEDGSYLRIQNIQLGYNLPKRLISKFGIINAIKLYASLNNYFTFTKYSGRDPEVSRYGTDNVGAGYDYGGYPTAKSIIFGINANF
ncbi:MAG: SusC/RagA family TonB-linked outer membrane protein [Bacteroidota bacterium]|nr:SusC/RagA family TonB-linked outer membrane protein [Bacteroidota bacterium]